MKRVMVAVMALLVTLPLFSQAPASKWTVGTVMAVKPHAATTNDSASADPRFDVTVRVGRTNYVVLYTQRTSAARPAFYLGQDVPVLVGPKTLKYSDRLGGQSELPILSRNTATSQQKAR